MNNSTSIQNIITHNSLILPTCDVNNLFATKKFPRFELDQFRMNNEIGKKQQFLFFLKVLEKWNQDVQNKNKQLKQCDYFKNQFIFSWLKSIAVQNNKFVDSSLRLLYQWYSSNQKNQPLYKMRHQNTNKSRIEDWQIRNFYKSNLPLEIDSYKRRYLYESSSDKLQSNNEIKPMSKTTLNSPKLSLLKQNNPTIFIKKQNNLLRKVREQNEVQEYLNNYKRQKIYLQQNSSKDFYRNQFNKDKLITSQNDRIKQQFYLTDSIKDYRVKTTIGNRPFGSPAMAQKTYSQFYSPKTDIRYNQQAIKVQLPSPIDGMSLMNNPFDIKIRKKKKIPK